MNDYTPTSPRVTEVALAQLSDKEWRYAWAAPKLRWAIAKQVHDIRVARGMSQHELARRIGTRQPAIARIENPRLRSLPTLATLLKIAEVFDRALIVAFTSWSEWLAQMAALESGSAPPPSYDEERRAVV